MPHRLRVPVDWPFNRNHRLGEHGTPVSPVADAGRRNRRKRGGTALGNKKENYTGEEGRDVVL